MFWVLLIGIALGAGFMYLAARSNITLAWYDYVLAVLGVVFAYLAIQNFVASFQELEPTAAWVMLAMFGVPALILLGVETFRIVRGRQSAA
ncbi:MAG: hypothetical protein WBH90_08785 [Aggregatilineales bacterium]|jgi:hypothetical protein|nr:dehalogenase [Chloroflexota bacterium]HPV06403.1 hypothetical protein [Aggregatilineales bacterium]HQE18378.1 hypothetical protein [Aggregatilineales bacterium]